MDRGIMLAGGGALLRDLDRLLAEPELAFCAHYLRSARRYRPHLLTEPEERILAEKAIAAEANDDMRTAFGWWNRVFDGNFPRYG